MKLTPATIDELATLLGGYVPDLQIRWREFVDTGIVYTEGLIYTWDPTLPGWQQNI